jgi:hypothetical protein
MWNHRLNLLEHVLYRERKPDMPIRLAIAMRNILRKLLQLHSP